MPMRSIVVALLLAVLTSAAFAKPRKKKALNLAPKSSAPASPAPASGGDGSELLANPKLQSQTSADAVREGKIKGSMVHQESMNAVSPKQSPIIPVPQILNNK